MKWFAGDLPFLRRAGARSAVVEGVEDGWGGSKMADMILVWLWGKVKDVEVRVGDGDARESLMR